MDKNALETKINLSGSIWEHVNQKQIYVISPVASFERLVTAVAEQCIVELDEKILAIRFKALI